MLILSALITGIATREHVRAARPRLPRHLGGVADGELRAGQLDDARRGATVRARRHALGWPVPVAVLVALALCARVRAASSSACVVRPFVRARVRRLADGDRGGRHRPRQRRCCSPSARSRAPCPRRSPASTVQVLRRAASIRCSLIIPVVGLAHRRRPRASSRGTPSTARRCSRSCRTRRRREPHRHRRRRARSSAAYALSTVFAGVGRHADRAAVQRCRPTWATLFGIKAFAVAILGGLDSARGVVLAGFLFGVTEALVTSLLGSSVHATSSSFGAGDRRAGPDAARAARPRGARRSMTLRGPLAVLRRRCSPASRCACSATATRRICPAAWSALTAHRRHRPQRADRLTGQISIGHVGFYAIGAYVTALLTTRLGVELLARAGRGRRRRRGVVGGAARRCRRCASAGRIWRW